ncbi:MAG: tetratricopeptide repeat protein [Desulfobacula sp.]|uniref:tetratricopeptide repeat protein n=1 Tax=Desulfobacula sp. TaxID=2593537 RepID=UPI0025C3560D|nr:tetratricopeptide repeat protein [Desulfobacula sp.]MCD4719841.1 tetratricopeptide repeat protein [Desulfobacula sp.]
MTIIKKILLFLLLFFFLFAGDAFGLGKYYLLKKGNVARDEGKIDEAIYHYQSYIVSHPIVLGINSAQYYKNKQYYIKNLLKAYSNLIDLYKTNHNALEIKKCINNLKTIYLSDDLGSKNKYSLALIFQNNNLTDDAILIFKKIIKEQKNNYNSFNNKVGLRSISKLLKIYQSQGKNDQLLSIIKTIKSDYPTFDFDLKDKYKLASLYLEYGFTNDGVLLLKEITNEQDSCTDPSEINTMIKAYSKLLIIHYNKNDKDALQALFAQMSAKCPLEILSPGNMYKIATTYLKCGGKNDGINLLKDISSLYSYSLSGRKALFLLGRLSQGNEDWDAAIKHYSEYINKYPDPPFFSLKAYSRLIDSYWSSNENKKLVQKEIETLADIANGMSDFETQLNLARDLKWKGMDELASATFDLGLFSAKTFIFKNQNTYQALRAHWIIEKYAYFLDRFDLVEQNADYIFAMIDKLKDSSFSEKEKIDYIQNQTYLWLAKINIDMNDFVKAKSYLKIFIEKYPRHKEIDYVRYELGKIFEEENKSDEALIQYGMIQSDMWKKMADKKVSGIKADE